MLSIAGKNLTEGVDYTVKYSNNKAVREANLKNSPKVTITGKNGYKGSINIFFSIVKNNIDTSNVNIHVNDVVYGKNKAAGKYKSLVKLTDINGQKIAASEYTVNYYLNTINENNNLSVYKNQKNVVNAGDNIIVVVNVKESSKKYQGSVQTSYKVVEKGLLNNAVVKTVGPKYFGKVTTLTEADLKDKVKVGNQYLVYGVDYVIDVLTYTNHNKVGKASVVIRDIGNQYGGSKTITYKIQPMNWNIASAKITSIEDKKYSGEAVKLSESDLSGKVILNGEVLVYGKDFAVIETSYKKM